jgi:hypothetical protein
MGTLSRDTERMAERELIGIMRTLSPARKLELLDDACRTTRDLMLAGLRRRNPQLSDRELHRMLMDLLLGERAAEIIWGPRTARER